MSIDLTDATPVDRAAETLTPVALACVQRQHERFAPGRDELLLAREGRRVAAATTGRLDFLSETVDARQADWQVAEPPPALWDRRVDQGQNTADEFERHSRPAADRVRHLCLDEDVVDFRTPPADELVS